MTAFSTPPANPQRGTREISIVTLISSLFNFKEICWFKPSYLVQRKVEHRGYFSFEVTLLFR